VLLVTYLRRLRQRPSLEFWLLFSWCGEPLSSATLQIPSLTEGWPRSLDAGATRVNRLVETTVF
jgi:hypothetical protein